MLDSLKPGQKIRCTVVKDPRTADRRSTISRLMRNDANAKRGLRKAHRKRMQNLVVYNRGNRDWTKREIVGKIVQPEAGQAWTMIYTIDLAPDFRSVDGFVKVEPA
ncbi:MAG: hypothetical protein JNM07_08035 [Phycisphaerae bacterium]|nr:hypothetical protein [Phycisphaerae bacterium]